MRLITKLNIIKGNILVKKGQFLWKESENDLLSKDGKLLSNGLYYVTSSQVNASHEGSNEFMHDLELCEVSYNQEDLKPTSNFYTISICKKDLGIHFGIGVSAKKGMVFEYIQDQFKKANKIGDFDTNQDYDRFFKGVASSIFSKSPIKIPIDIQSDLIMNAIMQVVTPKTVKEYDPNKKIEVYFVSMFRNRLLNEVKSYITKQMKEVHPLDDRDDADRNFTQEEKLDVLQKPSKETPESKLYYKELIQSIKKFMKQRIRGDVQIKVLDFLLTGHSNDDISKRLNVSPSLISRYMNDVRDSVLEYSKKTKNDTLYEYMIKFSKVKKHANEDFSYMIDVFKNYKKKVGGFEKTRVPSGDITKIRKVIFQDKISDEAIAKCILNDSYSSSNLKSDLDEYFSFLNDQDEVIESEDGKIVGLKILLSEIRNFKK
jgi:RNA polymerase sigma factor (sigma-70 family)